jgi:two-component system phosphate regulon sensor histidine kinase PhoR
MPNTGRKLVTGLLLFLAAGTFVGWLYGRPATGALAASLLALAWQVRQLILFDKALQTGEFDTIRFGDGIWQQLFSRFAHERDRGNLYKQDYRRLLREIRKSTNAMPDGAVILNDANEIIFCNRAAKRLAGLKRKKDRGQRVDNILRNPGLTELLHEDSSQRTIDIPSPMIANGWINCRIVPYGADQKLLLMRDVTERMALNKMRRDFVANASHELRSPLTVITGYVDAMADDETVGPVWKEPLLQMRDQARRMTRIISELLELSRLEGAQKASSDETVDVLSLMAAAKEACDGREAQPDITLAPDSMAQLIGDADEIESVIANLVSNALRHTPPDGRVTLGWRSDADGAELYVVDTGEGIAEEHISRLTERFFRVDRGRARTDGGVGLGLAIVKHVLGRHDAELDVKSEPGKGSEFCCRFPPERVIVGEPIPLAEVSEKP